MASSFLLHPGRLRIDDIRQIDSRRITLILDKSTLSSVAAGARVVEKILVEGRRVYGVNTGFGSLAGVLIPEEQVKELQRRLVLATSAGIGPPLPDSVVRLILLLKANILARGHSGVRPVLLDMLVRMFNGGVYPVIPAKGSVGASGDLAPLAHLTASLLGIGEVRVNGKTLPALEGLAGVGLFPLDLYPKEGLAMVNGTQVSTALAIQNLLAAENVFAGAIIAGALSVEAIWGSDEPFDERIHQLRGQPGQSEVAAIYRQLLAGRPTRKGGDRVQDPYSVRCQPVVMGAVLDHMRFAAHVFEREVNAVTDNPLVFAETGDVLSGGNFHAEPVAMASDVLALAIAEIGAMSERRIALLTDANMSQLPPFLVRDSGLNSGFMVAHVTAAALASENKALAHPVSVDSLPTSANQEDHVSMSTYAARRLTEMVDNAAGIVAIELLAAAQGVDIRGPLHTTQKKLRTVVEAIRDRVPFYDEDRFFAPEIAAIKELVTSGYFRTVMPDELFSVMIKE